MNGIDENGFPVFKYGDVITKPSWGNTYKLTKLGFHDGCYQYGLEFDGQTWWYDADSAEWVVKSPPVPTAPKPELYVPKAGDRVTKQKWLDVYNSRKRGFKVVSVENGKVTLQHRKGQHGFNLESFVPCEDWMLAPIQKITRGNITHWCSRMVPVEGNTYASEHTFAWIESLGYMNRPRWVVVDKNTGVPL